MEDRENDYTPYVVSWNVTKMCNLRCAHCYLDADYLTGRKKDELTTEEGFRLIKGISLLNPNTILILTGGEPLLREDIFYLAGYASKIGLMPVLGTNGMLLNERVGSKIIESGIKGIGISIDSIHHEIHDAFRGVKGAWERSIKGIEAIKRYGLQFQIQTTVTRSNYSEIPKIIEFAHELGCKVYNIFFLVCTGRGQGLTDITPEQYEEVLGEVVRLQDRYTGRMMIRAKCAPHFKRVAYQYRKDSPLLKGYASDCLAGVHYCRVTPEGDITPCPYMPLVGGSLKKDGFEGIWKNSPLLNEIREKRFKGRCRICEYRVICGGCRARAYATTKDYLMDDPWCSFQPTGDGSAVIRTDGEEGYWKEEKYELKWDEDAKRRLELIPFFARNMVVKGVERYAKERGIEIITVEVMREVREMSKMGPSHMNLRG
ncbi:MAG: radical SAM protein [Nitrospirae bacterium]|nr:radical SAM protein [Nitrospirota bacterium]